MPLSLRSSAVRFELDVTGYQFPNLVDDKWDSNWLHVGVSLDVGRDHFHRVDPCLTTFELDGLRRWFEAMASAPHAGASVDFTEPNLAFVISSVSPLVLRVTLSLELVPPWASGPLTLDFPTTSGDLEASARALDAMLKRFPRR